MPSRSSSPESITRSSVSPWLSNAPVCWSIALTRVVLPWSTCATMATLRSSSRVMVFADMREGSLPLDRIWVYGVGAKVDPTIQFTRSKLQYCLICVRTYRISCSSHEKLSGLTALKSKTATCWAHSLTSISGSSRRPASHRNFQWWILRQCYRNHENFTSACSISGFAKFLQSEFTQCPCHTKATILGNYTIADMSADFEAGLH